jgi:ABC-type multidrug transport system ATPase subunit
MRMLTAQSIPDEGEIDVLGYRLPGQSKSARARWASCRSSTTSTRR